MKSNEKVKIKFKQVMNRGEVSSLPKCNLQQCILIFLAKFVSSTPPLESIDQKQNAYNKIEVSE